MGITITVKRTGPYFINEEDAAQLTIVDHDGNVLTPPPSKKRSIVLCRCGESSTKPFCDGTHKVNGFLCDVDPGANTQPTAPADPPAVESSPAADGRSA